MKKSQRGFTLIELMIVVAIIGILAAVAIPKFADMLRKSKEGATKGSLTNLRSALTIYISDNEGENPMMYWTSYSAVDLTSVICPKYMEGIPTAKLGTYHADSGVLRISAVNNRTKALDDALDGTAENDLNGWFYTSSSGGGWWVSCTHTDTKNALITAW